jgi:hypothetical protein
MPVRYLKNTQPKTDVHLWTNSYKGRIINLLLQAESYFYNSLIYNRD